MVGLLVMEVETPLFFFLLMGFIPLQIYPQSVHVMCLLLTSLCTMVYTIAGNPRAMGHEICECRPVSFVQTVITWSTGTISETESFGGMSADTQQYL